MVGTMDLNPSVIILCHSLYNIKFSVSGTGLDAGIQRHKWCSREKESQMVSCNGALVEICVGSCSTDTVTLMKA
jgi:hypothetical protein